MRKLAKHVKGVREKKTKPGKERTFHRLSPSITRTLIFQPYTTLLLLKDLQEMKNTKRKKKKN